jgi:putative hydrolase of the HAD superfamily
MNSGFDHIIFDWGDTVMKDNPARTDAMYLWPKVELVDGAAEVLSRLALSCKIYIATSAASDEAMVRKALARVGVDGCFHAVFTAHSTGVPKTDPRFWQYILKALNTRPERVMMVGDNFKGDVLTPSQQGIQAVWFNPHSAEVRSGENYRTIHKLSDLIAQRKAAGFTQ